MVSYEVTVHDGRDPIIFDLSTPESVKKAKTEGFDLKKGEEYKTSLKLTVEADRISELDQTQVVFREGIRHSRGTKMLVRFIESGLCLQRGLRGGQRSFGSSDTPNVITTPHKCEIPMVQIFVWC